MPIYGTKYVVYEKFTAQQMAIVEGEGDVATKDFKTAYQIAAGSAVPFEVWGGKYTTTIGNVNSIDILDSGSLSIVSDKWGGSGYVTTTFVLNDLNFLNNGTVSIANNNPTTDETKFTPVTFELKSSSTEKKLTFTNNNSLTVQNAAFKADKVVNAETAQIVLKNATFTVGDVQNAGLIRITGGDIDAALSGEGTVWLATTFNDSAITGDNNFIVKYVTTLNDSTVEGTSLSVDLGNLTLNGGELAFDDVTIASGKYLFVDGEGNSIDFGTVTGTVSVKAGAVLSDSTVGAGTVYFGKNTALVGKNAFDIIQVSGASYDPESADYRKLTIGNDVAPTVDPETGDVTFETELTANKIQLGAATKYGNLDIQNAKIDVENLNSANEGNVVNVAGKSDLTIGNLTGSINLANGADVTADIEDAADGAAFNVGYTTTDTFDPESGKPTPAANAWVTVTETVESSSDVATLAGVAEDVDVNVEGGILNVLGTAVVDDVETSVVGTTTTVTGTTYHYDNKKKEIVADRVEKTTTKAKKLTGTVNVGAKAGNVEAALSADDITNAGAFNVYGKATLVADDIANAGTLNFAKGSFIAVGDIDGNAESKTGTVTIASENAVINSITNQKSVSISAGANLSDVEAISENTAVTITAASVEVNELLDNGTVTIGKGESTLTVGEFAGTINMSDGAILADSVIAADQDQKPIAETEDNVIYVGTSKLKLYKKDEIVEIGKDGNEIITAPLAAALQTYKGNIASFTGANIATADLAIDGGTANVTGVLVIDDVALLNNTLPGPKVTFKAGTTEETEGKAVVKSNGSAVSTLNIAAEADAELPAVVVTDAVTNAGAINVGTKDAAGKLIVLGTDEGEALTNNGTVTVNAKGELKADTFVNAKTFTLSGTADIDTLGNTGTATVNAGAELTAGDIVNDGIFNVKGDVVADSLTNNKVANKKFEVAEGGYADIADVDNAGLINVFGHLDVGTFTEVEGEENPEFEGGTLTNVGTVNLGSTVGNVGAYMSVGDIINGKAGEPAVGEQDEAGYIPAVDPIEGTINVGNAENEELPTCGLVADSITNYAGEITIAIGSYLDADTITNYATITVDSLGADNASSATAGRLYANSILNKEGATLNLAGVLGSIAEDDAQVLTITAEVGSTVNFARWTTAENVKIVGGGTINLGNQFHYNTLVLSGATLTSSGNFYTVGEDTSITIDAASSIKTNSFGADDTIIFDATNIDSIAEKDIKWTLVNADVSAVTLMVKLAEGAELVKVTDNLQISEDYTIVKRDDKITLTKQSQSTLYVDKQWTEEAGYVVGKEFEAVINGETVTLTMGFNAFADVNDITYHSPADGQTAKYPASKISIEEGEYTIKVDPDTEKHYFYYLSDRDVTLVGAAAASEPVVAEPAAEPAEPGDEPVAPVYTVTLKADSGRTYLMQAVNYNKVQTGVDADNKPIFEYSVTDKDGNAITAASPDFPTFTIDSNLILVAGMLKVGDVLDDDPEDSDWSLVEPGEGEEFPTFKGKRTGGVANLVVEGQLKGFFSLNPYSTITVAETGKVISTIITGGVETTNKNVDKKQCSYIRNTATVTVNGAFEDGEAAGENAAAADKQFRMYRVAFADGGTLNLNDTRAEISVLRLYNPAGAILKGTTAVINVSNSYVDTTDNDLAVSDTTKFFSPDSETTKQAVELNLTDGSVLNVKKDFNPLADTTVNVDASTLQVASLTNAGAIIAKNGAVIKNVAGGEFANNADASFALNASTLTVTEAWFINKGTFFATNGSDITGSIRNNGGLFVLADSTIGADAAMTFSNWAGFAVINSSVAKFASLSNDDTFAVVGESSLSVANTFTGTVELVDATLTDSVIVAGGLLNIAANLPIPAENPPAEPVANEVTFAGGNVIAATIDNAGTANFTTTGDAVNAIATFNNAEGATLAISGNLTKAGEAEASIKNDGTASATGATIDYVMLNNNGEFTLSGTSLTSNSSSAVWNKGTFSVLAHSTLDATILNQGTGSVTIDASTINKEIKNNSATGTVTVTGSSEIAAVTNDGTFSMTSSNATGDITNNKTFTANGGSITGDITNAAGATFTMENAAQYIGKAKVGDNYTNYTITNAGTFNLTGAMITGLEKINNVYYGATINNTGMFNVTGGFGELSAKKITTGDTDNNKFNVKGNGSLTLRELDGKIHFNGTTNLSSAKISGTTGEVIVDSGKTLTTSGEATFTKVTNNGTITAEKALTTGELTNAGTINASDNVTTGKFTNNDGKTFKATGSGKTVTVNGELSNSGTFDVTGNLATNGNAITNVKNKMTVGGTLKTTKQNAASGNVTITAGSITATGAMEVGDVANNGGTLTAKAGLKAGAVTNGDGKTIAVTGALNTSGKITNSGSLTADSVATNGKDIENVKNTFTVKGALNTTKQNAASGSVTVTSGKIDVINNGAATIGALTVGVVNGGSGTFNAASLNSGDVMVNRGTVSITGAATVGTLGIGDANSGTFTAASLKSNAITVTKGTVTITNAIRAKGIITNSGTISAGSVDSRGYAITNNANATITVTGDLTTKPDSGNNYGAVTNNGTFTVDGNVTTGAFTSEGGNFSIKAKADKSVTMTVNGNFSNIGTLTIDVTALKDKIAVGEQVQVVSVTGDVLTSVGNIALTGTDHNSFKKIIQVTGDKKGIYLYKTDEVVSAPTIYVNGAWNDKSAGDQIEFPEGSQTPLTFGLDAFAGTNTLDLASDTKELKIVYSGGYDALNITQSLDVTIWNSTGTSPAAQSQVFAGLSVSGDKTVANLRGQKITSTAASTIAAGCTLDLRSNEIMDRDPSTMHTGAEATLTISGAGKIMTDWNSTLTLGGSVLAANMLDIDVTGYAGGDATIIKGYGQENHYKAAVGAEKYNKYFTVSGNDLKMNTSAREVIYVNSASAYDIESAIEYTWVGADQTTEYHADTIAILGGNYAEVLSFEGIDGQKIIVDNGVFTKSVYGGNVEEGTGTGRLNKSVTGNINIEVNGGSFKNLVAGDNIKTKAIYSRTGNINLSISGTASFTSVVAAGMMCQLDAGGSLIELVGNTNLTISGGNFAKTVYGGMFATKLNSSGNTYLDGKANVTVVGGDDKITFGDGLCVGSYGYGGISKGTALTLTGNAEMIKFTGTGTDIWGGCSGDYYTTSDKYESSMDTGAKRTLTFSGFEGNFAGCDSINGFSDVFVQDDTDVVLSKGINLKHVDNWTFECGSTLAGAFANDLTKDTLRLQDYTSLKAGDSWTLFGADVELSGVDAQMNVYFGATKVAYDTTAGGWVSGEYTLKYTEDDGLFLKNTAVLA